mgnify:CR=1 FL=1
MKTGSKAEKPRALKVHADLKDRLQRFCQDHSVVPKNTIYNKALAFYLDYAEHGVDFNLNPLHLDGKRR